MEIRLQKMNFSNVCSQMNKLYNVLVANRARLAPWFWWAEERITSNKLKFSMLMMFLLCDTKYRELRYKLDFKKIYREQFFIYANNEFRGMIGLDEINHTKSDAELWGWITRGEKTVEIVDQSFNLLQDYCIKDKKLTSLYAKTQVSNKPANLAAFRNGFKIKSTEHNIPISLHSPKFVDIITWEKQLVR